MQIAEEGEAVFNVHLKLEGTGLVKVSVGLVLGRTVRAGTDASHREGTDGVGAANIELLYVRHLFGITVCMFGADEETRHKPVLCAGFETARIDYLSLSFHELGKRCAEELFLAFLSGCLPYSPEDVAGFCHGEGKVESVNLLSLKELRQIIGIGHLRYKLAHETECYGRICLHDGIENGCGVL